MYNFIQKSYESTNFGEKKIFFKKTSATKNNTLTPSTEHPVN